MNTTVPPPPPASAATATLALITHSLPPLNDKTTTHQGEGDTVTAKVLPDQPGQVVIESIVGDGGRLSLVAADNCVGIAAMETLKLLGSPSCGVSLTLNKVRRCSHFEGGRV